MIKSWGNSVTRRFVETGKVSRLRGMDAEAALELVAVLDAATSLADLSPLKSIGLQKLRGDRRSQWAMTINGSWKLCFRFQQGDAYDVEINYHKG